METWKDIPGFEGVYQASDRGRIRSLTRPRHPGRVLRQHVTANGYLHVQLSMGGKVMTKSVHRLVALTFLGEPPKGLPLVLHGDGVETNNRIENLRYGTQEQNLADRVTHGTSTRGECHNALLTAESVREIRAGRETGMTYRALAEKFSVSISAVSNVLNGRSWAWVDEKVG